MRSRRIARITLRALFLTPFAVGLATLAASAAEYEFSWRLPTPQGNAICGTDFESETTGYAVGPRGTVLVTADAGVTWTPRDLFPDFDADLQDVLVLGAGHLLAAGAPPGIFESTDAGISWSPVVNPSTGTLNDLEVVSGSILSAVGSGGEVIRSTDSGTTWALLPSPGSEDLNEQLWLDPANGYVLGKFLARRTTDGGQTWAPLDGVTEFTSFNEAWSTDPAHITILNDFEIWRTTNGGVTWTGNPVGPLTYMGNTVVLGPLHYLVATNLEGAFVWETTDGGDTWTERLFGSMGGFLDFDRLSDGTLILPSSDGDIYRSTDDGQTWTNATHIAAGPERGAIGAVAVGPGGSGAAGTTGSPPTYWFRTIDGGSSWQADPQGPAIAAAAGIGYWDVSRAVAAGDSGRMWRTTDGGASWSPVDLAGAPAGGRAGDLALPAPGVAFVPVMNDNESKVYRTTDHGETWQPRSAGILATSGLRAISFLNASAGFTGGYLGSAPVLYKTTDGGGSWSGVGTTGLPSWLNDMHWSDSQTGFVTLHTGSPGIYRTTNGGGLWTNVWPFAVHRIAFSPDGVHGAATQLEFFPNGTLAVTEDGGATWESLALPATTSGTCITATEEGFWVGGYGNCILEMTRIDPASSDDLPPAPGDESRIAVRARPSIGDRFEIEYRAAGAGSVDLSVYDVLGRRVAALVSAGAADSGIDASSRTVSWNGLASDGRPASPGIYFVRFEAGGEVRAVKIVVRR
ncbi:MAG: YCF48-related protein [Candidatus Eisenbacteria bacterium]